MYPCGLHGGEQLRLLKDLVIADSDGNRVGGFEAGSMWTVIGGDTHRGEVVWLFNPDGERHTWDNETMFEWFEVVTN